MPRPRTPRIVERGGQAHLNFEGLEEMAWMPRCAKTGANIDLHLVAYKDPDSGESTAAILGADYRHLVRRTTTLSIPVWALSEGTLRMLERRSKIPPGTEAVRELKAWLRQGVDISWREFAEAKNVRQIPLDLERDEAAYLGL